MTWIILTIVSFVGIFVGVSLYAEGVSRSISLTIASVSAIVFLSIIFGAAFKSEADFEERCEAKGGVVVDIYRGDDVCLKDEDVLIKE